MKTLAYVVALLLTVAVSAQAQDSFMVMSVKGKAEVSAKGKTWKKVEVGQVFGKRDVIRTSFASYVKLMMNEDRLVSIDENTTKPLAEFIRAKSSRGEGSAGKILQYAAAQMTKTRQKQGGNDFGAVRGGMEVFAAVFPMHAVLSPEPRFEWIDSDSTGNYELLILDDQLAAISRKQVQNVQFALDVEPGLLKPGATYHWQLARVNDPQSAQWQTFTVLPQDTINFVQRELESLDRELTSMKADDVTRHLIRAIYFERRGLFGDAFREYKTTVRLAPEIQEYRDMLRGLLVSMRLMNEEEYLLR